ncbi:hypothetical protein KKG71_03895 [Patescibacteria group bacterium]|nr:hypothetical protein [Patescibacteria group bacterium]
MALNEEFDSGGRVDSCDLLLKDLTILLKNYYEKYYSARLWAKRTDDLGDIYECGLAAVSMMTYLTSVLCDAIKETGNKEEVFDCFRAVVADVNKRGGGSVNFFSADVDALFERVEILIGK